jgi:hypothetical protein
VTADRNEPPGTTKEPLSAQDLALFEHLRIPCDLLAAACVRRVDDGAARDEYGVRCDGDMSGVIYPYLDPVSGRRVTARLRRDHPDTVNGKQDRKYICPPGDTRHLYFPPDAGALLADVAVPVIFVEAEKSTLAATAAARRAGRRYLVVGVGGCYGWRGKTGVAGGPNGAREQTRGPLPDLHRIVWRGRKAVIAFDSNVASNHKVRAARDWFAQTLVGRGAQVFLANQPEEPGVNGPDDYITVHGDQALLAMLDAAMPFPEVPGVLASEVMPQKVQWFWRDYIPLGKVTMFDGDPDEGKSMVTGDLVARTTSGSVMPDRSAAGCPGAGAVIVSLEDGAADTIVPRLIAAGADLSKVRIISTVRDTSGIERTPRIPEDLPAIEAAIRNVGAALLIIDPLSGVLDGNTDSHRDQDVRRSLAPLAALAERTGVAVICIRHLNKSGGLNPKYRGGGSIGIIGAARAAFLFGSAPGRDGVHVMAPIKGNLWRKKPPALEYSIGEKNQQPVVIWDGESQCTAASLLAPPESKEESNAITLAKDFLRGLLAGGPKAAEYVLKEAHDAGVAQKTLYRAKNELRVASRKEGMEDGWVWALPEKTAKAANNQDLAIFGESAERSPGNSCTSPKVAKIDDNPAFSAGHLPLDGDDGEGKVSI